MSETLETFPEWLPIETAPKDSFLLLLYQKDEGVCAGYWDICESPPVWRMVETQGADIGLYETHALDATSRSTN